MKYDCPVWGDDTNNLGLSLFQFLPDKDDVYVHSPRTGGEFRFEDGWAKAVRNFWDNVQANRPNPDRYPIAELGAATERQKANLSFWIYQQNLSRGLLNKQLTPHSSDQIPLLSPEIVGPLFSGDGPNATDRLFFFVRELLRQTDIDKRIQGYLWAASAASTRLEVKEFYDKVVTQKLVALPYVGAEGKWDIFPTFLTLDARLWVEEQLGGPHLGRQGFVAMWFDKSMNECEEAIKEGIGQAGYEAYLVKDDKHHSDKIDSRIIAAIQRSRFIVADFTCCSSNKKNKEGNARGSVYYEAGFAEGLGKPVIYTCHKDCLEGKHLHFDTRQINHLEWETPQDLAEQLKNSIEARLGIGPMQSQI